MKFLLGQSDHGPVDFSVNENKTGSGVVTNNLNVVFNWMGVCWVEFWFSISEFSSGADDVLSNRSFLNASIAKIKIINPRLANHTYHVLSLSGKSNLSSFTGLVLGFKFVQKRYFSEFTIL